MEHTTCSSSVWRFSQNVRLENILYKTMVAVPVHSSFKIFPRLYFLKTSEDARLSRSKEIIVSSAPEMSLSPIFNRTLKIFYVTSDIKDVVYTV